MSDATPSPRDGSNAAPPALKLKVIGVGGAGGRVAAHLARHAWPGLTCLAVNTDLQALDQCAGVQPFLLGRSLLSGLSAGGDPKLGRAAAEADEEALRELTAGADLVFVIAGMGGGTGSGAAPLVARAAKASGALVLGVAAMPFEMEGSRRQRQAILGLARLRQEADTVICVANQHLLRLVDGQTPVAQLFDQANARLAEAVAAIWRMLAWPGLINLDFSALRSALAGRHAESCLAAAEATGDNRPFEVWEKLMQSPDLQHPQALSDAETVLVNLVGGDDFLTAEMEWLLANLQSRAPDAKLLMGVATDPAFTGRLAMVVISSRFSETTQEAPVAAVAVAPQEAAARTQSQDDLKTQVLGPELPRTRSRFVPPAPVVSPEKAQQLYRRQSGRTRRKKEASRQGLLPLEIVSKGRFEKSEATLHDGEDLDVPTYIRRGVVLQESTN